MDPPLSSATTPSFKGGKLQRVPHASLPASPHAFYSSLEETPPQGRTEGTGKPPTRSFSPSRLVSSLLRRPKAQPKGLERKFFSTPQSKASLAPSKMPPTSRILSLQPKKVVSSVFSKKDKPVRTPPTKQPGTNALNTTMWIQPTPLDAVVQPSHTPALSSHFVSTWGPTASSIHFPSTYTRTASAKDEALDRGQATSGARSFPSTTSFLRHLPSSKRSVYTGDRKHVENGISSYSTPSQTTSLPNSTQNLSSFSLHKEKAMHLASLPYASSFGDETAAHTPTLPFFEAEKKKNEMETTPSYTKSTIKTNDKRRLSYLEWFAQTQEPKQTFTLPPLPPPSSSSSSSSAIFWILPRRETTWNATAFTPQKYPIGKGRTGYVYQAIETATHRPVALKIMLKETILSMGFQKQLKNEISIHSSLNHINIIKLWECFEDAKKIYLVLEFANFDSLGHRLRQRKGPLSEKEAAHYTYQLAAALDYLHAHAIIHRDVKPENILIHSLSPDALKAASLNPSLYSFGILKLADFGFACRLEKSRPKRSTVCGTLDYIPPEIALRSSYDQNVDLWCLGVTLYELLVGVPPFSAPTHEMFLNKIANVDFRFPSTFPAEPKMLISQLCQKEASQRLSPKAILTHPWIKKHVAV